MRSAAGLKVVIVSRSSMIMNPIDGVLDNLLAVEPAERPLGGQGREAAGDHAELAVASGGGRHALLAVGDPADHSDQPVGLAAHRVAEGRQSQGGYAEAEQREGGLGQAPLPEQQDHQGGERQGQQQAGHGESA